MKKYITLAALLAAGAVSANAATFSIEDAVYSSGNGNPVVLDTPLSSLTATVTLDVNALKAVMLAGSSLSKHTLIDFTDADKSDIGLQTNYSSRNNVILTSGLYGSWNQGSAYDVGIASGIGFESQSFWENVTAASATLTYSYSTGTTAILALQKTDTTTGSISYETYGGTWNTTLKGSGLAFDSISFDSSIVESTYIFNNVVTVENAKSLSLSTIPEPSAFGLLAGVGALALVASRRRRTQKI